MNNSSNNKYKNKNINKNTIINNSIKAKKLHLNIGSHPKSLNYCKPTLQLDGVLNGNQLQEELIMK